MTPDDYAKVRLINDESPCCDKDMDQEKNDIEKMRKSLKE